MEKQREKWRGKERKRKGESEPNWQHLRHRCNYHYTREDFNMHRLTDVPQRADFKCKYKSAMQTAELVWAALGWRKVSKGVRTDSVQRWKNHFARSSTSVCVCMRVFVEQSNYNSLPLCFLAVEVYIRGNGACSLCPVDSYERSFSLVSA